MSLANHRSQYDYILAFAHGNFLGMVNQFECRRINPGADFCVKAAGEPGPKTAKEITVGIAAAYLPEIVY